jgi:hypothetical protein
MAQEFELSNTHTARPKGNVSTPRAVNTRSFYLGTVFKQWHVITFTEGSDSRFLHHVLAYAHRTSITIIQLDAARHIWHETSLEKCRTQILHQRDLM